MKMQRKHDRTPTEVYHVSTRIYKHRQRHAQPKHWNAVALGSDCVPVRPADALRHSTGADASAAVGGRRREPQRDRYRRAAARRSQHHDGHCCRRPGGAGHLLLPSVCHETYLAEKGCRAGVSGTDICSFEVITVIFCQERHADKTRTRHDLIRSTYSQLQ